MERSIASSALTMEHQLFLRAQTLTGEADMEFEDGVRLLYKFQYEEPDGSIGTLAAGMEGVVLITDAFGLSGLAGCHPHVHDRVLVSFGSKRVCVPERYLDYAGNETSPPARIAKPEEYIHFYGLEPIALRSPLAIGHSRGAGFILGPETVVMVDTRGAFPVTSDEVLSVWRGPGHFRVEFSDLHVPEERREAYGPFPPTGEYYATTFRKGEKLCLNNQADYGDFVIEPGSRVEMAEDGKRGKFSTVAIFFPGFRQDVPVRCLQRTGYSTNPNCGVSVYTWRG